MKEKKRIGHDDRINIQAKVELLFSHINSYVRGSNENRTPYDLMVARFAERVILIVNGRDDESK